MQRHCEQRKRRGLTSATLVYTHRPSPASPLTFSLLNSPPLCLPEVLAGYYPCVCGKLYTVKSGGVRRKRSLWSRGEKEGAALLSTNLLCVSGLSLINDRLYESRPAALAFGSMPCQNQNTKTAEHKTLLASQRRSYFTQGNVLLRAQVTNRCSFKLLRKTRAQLEMWHFLRLVAVILWPPCGDFLCQLPQFGLNNWKRVFKWKFIQD